MKMLLPLLLAFLLAFIMSSDGDAQQPIKNYDTEWKKVDDLMKKALPKSALEETRKILAKARAEKQDAQVVKAIIYIDQLQQETREDNETLSIKSIEMELVTAREPVHSLLSSLLASAYLNYYNEIRWELSDRTATENFKKDDVSTWTAEDFKKRITELYLESLRNKTLLQQLSLPPFDALIHKGNVRHLRPTLYDLLVDRALDFFESDEIETPNPVYAFVNDQAAAFDPAADFARRKFPTKDSLSSDHRAILLYQDWISFHLNDKKPDALIDIDLRRINYMKQESVHPEKDELYYKAIYHVAHQYEMLPAASQAWFLLASWHYARGSKYHAYGDSTLRMEKVVARDLLKKIVAQKDSSEGKTNALSLLAQLERPGFSFEVEKINVPELPFRALITYKNTGKMYFRIIRSDDALKAKMAENYGRNYWPALLNAKQERSWEQALNDPKDLQDHKVEIKVDALPIGEYILLAADQKEFSTTTSVLGMRMFFVSNIAYVHDGSDYFVLNRDNGLPLKGAKVQVWKQEWVSGKSGKKKAGTYETDQNGFFKMPKKTEAQMREGDNSFELEITHNSDRLFIDEWEYDYNNYYSNQETEKLPATTIVMFGDRSIYRPGQKVFFKGIVFEKNKNGKTGTVATDYEVKIYLRDANSVKVDSVTLRTNEYGSVNGNFVLPTTGLNGSFTIGRGDETNFQFQVEDYKRPKFEVTFEPIKGTFKVNDKLTVTGNAKAYAGNNIDGAMVKYRVVRQPRYMYPWMFSKWWMPPTDAMEIAHGETKTDKDGKFVVNFEAIPDLTIDKKMDPVFDYVVTTDITDLNGETRSGEKTVSVSYKALQLVVFVPEVLEADSLKTINVRTENFAGEFEPAMVNVKITKLKTEKRLIRSRFWTRPDQFVMTKEEYLKYFPFDEYDNETDYKTWEKEQQVLDKTDSSRKDDSWKLDKKFAAGFYMAEFTTKDKDGQLVKDVKYFQLNDSKSSKLEKPAYLWSTSSGVARPGETAKLQVGTSAMDVFLIQQLNRDSKTSVYSFEKLDATKKTFEFPVKEDDRGGFGVNWLFVKHNRFYQSDNTVNVPWENKDLNIEYATYRDKTLPGAEEKWTVKITGFKKEKVAAEMLGSMYDASLDQFYPHGWSVPSIWPTYYRNSNWTESKNFSIVQSSQKFPDYKPFPYLVKEYDVLFEGNRVYRSWAGGRGMVMRSAAPVEAQMSGKVSANLTFATKDEKMKESNADGITDKFDAPPPPPQQKGEAAGVQVRKNFNETAFFFPELHTNADGSISFSFTMPDALTKWKFQALAHTKDLSFGYTSKEIVTQKDLMVQPNAPRFLREGDKIEFSSKIVNLTDKEMTGQAELQLVDATTNESVDGWFHNSVPNQYFTVGAGQSELVTFPLEVPYLFDKALVWRIVARSGAFSDGEENAMPVLTNRMLVTESMTLPMRGNGTKEFNFTKLLNSGSSESLQQHSLTVEYTSNPAWYAVQSLPYLVDYPYECAEQTWNKYYANSLATLIANSSPKIREVFEKWRISDTAALMSNLQKNQELKSVLLEETPWVLDAKSESEQKKNIAMLFVMLKMSQQLNASFEKFRQLQGTDGAFAWFAGGRDDRYITQYIISGMGHLKKLGALQGDQVYKVNQVATAAIKYLDAEIQKDYEALVRNKADLKKYTPSYLETQYFYLRSFFMEIKVAAASQKAYDYFRDRMKQTWTTQGKYMQGMIALSLSRTGDAAVPAAILKSLKETSINNEELGMYWKDFANIRGWFWYQAPIESQALMIEVFQEVGKDKKTVDDLRTWLLKNKQTNSWATTKATAEACYALLLQGTQWLTNTPVVEVRLGSTVIRSSDNKEEAGTGYFKKIIDPKTIKPEMGKISVSVNAENINAPTSATWGAVYWQYFEDLDKITTAETPLKLVKKLFVEKNTDRGPVLTPINNGDAIHIGDKIKVRVELRVDRDMEYVHMKDMRASAFEPVNVLSSYKWQGGLGYYESTRDASTNFFFDNLRKGTYVFEYPLFATHEGNFSNGITTIQCMYAPEFTAHSEGVRVNVEKK